MKFKVGDIIVDIADQTLIRTIVSIDTTKKKYTVTARYRGTNPFELSIFYVDEEYRKLNKLERAMR